MVIYHIKSNTTLLDSSLVLSSPSRRPESVHRLLLEELRHYFFVGGMPESVLAYSETGSLQEAFDIHGELVNTYRDDFSKYAPYADSRIRSENLPDRDQKRSVRQIAERASSAADVSEDSLSLCAFDCFLL